MGAVVKVPVAVEGPRAAPRVAAVVLARAAAAAAGASARATVEDSMVATAGMAEGRAVKEE